VQALSSPSSLLAAFNVPGKFSLNIASLLIEVPNAVTVTGSGIHVNYDPSYNPADHGGAPQTLVTLDHASIAFPAFGVTGDINTITVNNQKIPGLTVYSDGFKLGEAELTYRPTSGQPLDLGILKFNDLRIGVQDLEYHTGTGLANFSGGVFFATGGVQF